MKAKALWLAIALVFISVWMREPVVKAQIFGIVTAATPTGTLFPTATPSATPT